MTDAYTRAYDERKRAGRNELIRDRFASGATARGIAREFGLGVATVNEILYDVRVEEPQGERAPLVDGACVYFIQEKDTKYVKIGVTGRWSPQERLKQLQTGNPRRLILRRVVPGNRELELHDRFSHLRVRGEWFRVSADLEAFMASEEDE